MNKVSVATAAPATVDDAGVAKTVISSSAVNDLKKQMETINKTADDLKKSLTDAKVDTKVDVKIDKVLTIKTAETPATTTGKVTKSEVALPADILTAADESKIDKIALVTSVATIAVPPKAIKANAGETVSISAGVVDNNTLKSTLTASIDTALNTKKDALAEIDKQANEAAGDETKLKELAEKKKTLADEILVQEQNKEKLDKELKALEEAGTTVYDFSAIASDASSQRQISSFSEAIEISVPYTLKPGEEADKITVYYLADDGTLQNQIGIYVDGKVTFTTNHFSVYFVKYNVVNFSDLAATEWARTEIEAMAAKGIIQGMGDNMYAPKSQLTRAQFATMIVNAFKLQNTTVQNVFTDVKDTDWFYSAVLSAYASGIIKGVTDTTFNPNANISRQDMAVMISRALVLLNDADETKDRSASITIYTDKTDITGYAVKGFEMTTYYGIMIGDTNNKLNPKGNATRAEAAIVLYRLFNTVY